MLDAAAAAYVTLTASGTDTLLMAADHATRRELSRRIRDDLVRLGLVGAGNRVRIADGGAASPGDLIVCTRNDHAVEAGESGRTLANGDLLRIDAVTAGGLLVRRAAERLRYRSPPLGLLFRPCVPATTRRSASRDPAFGWEQNGNIRPIPPRLGRSRPVLLDPG